jgi:hypothetical protein
VSGWLEWQWKGRLRRLLGGVETVGVWAAVPADEEVPTHGPLNISTFFEALPDPRRDGRDKKHALHGLTELCVCYSRA